MTTETTANVNRGPRYDEGVWLRDVALLDGADRVEDNDPPVGIPALLRINGEAPPWPVYACTVGPVTYQAGLTVSLTILQTDWHVDAAVYETRIGDMRVLTPGDGRGTMDPAPIENADGTVTVTVYVRSLVLGTPPPD